jgi:hypothetical protein
MTERGQVNFLKVQASDPPRGVHRIVRRRPEPVISVVLRRSEIDSIANKLSLCITRQETCHRV